MNLRVFGRGDIAWAAGLWSDSARAGEVAYKPLSPESFSEILLDVPAYQAEQGLVAEVDGRPVGFAIGHKKAAFLPGETHENTPGYLTALLVERAQRGKGVGTALLNALGDVFRAQGKRSIACASTNPVNLAWTVPGTPGHDHNNAPGVDQDCAGYPFLLARGFRERHREVAMYLDLARYHADPQVALIRQRLASEGVYTGRYDVKLGYEFDGMCDRVGSEYWRKVLRDEIAAPDPRPILVATHERSIVGFTGPVDRQASGRGFFTGICTDPLYERRGIATVLFNLLMQEFICVGARFSTLFTGEENHAQRLYLRAGFSVVKRFSALSKEL